MHRPIAVVLLAGTLFGAFGTTLRAEITAEQVRQAIDRGVTYLKGQQRRTNPPWTDYSMYTGGVTSLCTLALLNSGVEPDDETVRRALEYLRGQRLDTTYAVSLQTMVLCRSGSTVDLAKITTNARWLEAKQLTSGPRTGAWSYGARDVGGDNSNTQFALLALHEAERAGVRINPKTWRLAKTYWEGCQNIDGSWGYTEGVPGTGSMTCAGISSMVIASDKVRQADARADGDRVLCCQQTEAENASIQRALQWLGQADNFSVTHNPGSRGTLWLQYYLYGLERVGRMTSRRFIGEHDWYREGSEQLLRDQDPLSGFWRGSGQDEENPLISTSLALLFLSKGRRPVLMAKLKQPTGDDWNRHRSDVDNLTRHVESRWKMDLTWQVVELRKATVDDLLQSPVLFLSGGNSPLPDDAAEREALAQKLRDYIDRGGFLFAEAECGGRAFDEGFRQLIRQVFDEPEYRLHLLDPEHPIWYADEKVDPDQVRPLWGIEFGCRTSVVYVPPDPPGQPRPSLGCLWELSRGGRDEEFNPAVAAQIDAAMALGANVLAYATNRELKGKEDAFDRVVTGPATGASERGQILLAKLRHPGGCDAAPRALVNLLEVANRDLDLPVSAREDLVSITSEALFDYHLVFMHGRNQFRLTDGEREQLRTYIERGGMLLADSICASEAFTRSFRQEMEILFADHPLEAIPATDPMLTDAYGGFSLESVTRRDPQQGDPGEPLKATLRKEPPRLEGIRLDGRWAVVFSRYDLSCALEKHASLECSGYQREDAARIGVNVILYSLQQ